jgi:cytidine deaminase
MKAKHLANAPTEMILKLPENIAVEHHVLLTDKKTEFDILAPNEMAIKEYHRYDRYIGLKRLQPVGVASGINLREYLARVCTVVDVFSKIKRRVRREQVKFSKTHINCLYSKFLVIAVCFWRLCDDQTNQLHISYGTNFENIVYDGAHAEEIAMINAHLDAKSSNIIIEAIAIISPNDEIIKPCGKCRQALAELSPVDRPIIIFGCTSSLKNAVVTSLSSELPNQFPAKKQGESIRKKTVKITG